MKIKFVKDFNGIKKGTVVDIVEASGKHLISKKIAVDASKIKEEVKEEVEVSGDAETEENLEQPTDNQ